MFFRVACHTDTKICFVCSLQFIFQVNTGIKVSHLLQQIAGIFMSAGFRFKSRFILCRITPQHQYIINTQVTEIDQRIFRIIQLEATADKMGHRIHIIFIHNSGTDTFRAGAFSHHHFFKTAICLFFEYMFAPVIGNIDKRWFEFHQADPDDYKMLQYLCLSMVAILQKKSGCLLPGLI